MNDLISRQAAIDAICNACGKIDCDKMDKCEKLQLPPANCSEFPNSSDMISRAKAIEALWEKRQALNDYMEILLQDGKMSSRYLTKIERNRIEEDINIIEELPPAQLGTNLAEVGTDCISRQAAIDALDEQHYTSMTTNPTPYVTEQDKHNSLVIVRALQMAKTIIEAEGET